MTLITGLLTSSGIVLAADSAGSIGPLARLPVEKIGQLVEGDPSAWYGGAGSVARIQDLRLYFRQYLSQFQPRTLAQLTDLEVRNGLRQAALQVMNDIQQAWQRQPQNAPMMNPQNENTAMLLAVCGSHGHRLFGVEAPNAATLQATLDNPLTAIGSGSVGAIPFYSFLRRSVYPHDELQDKDNALLAVCWIQYQVISTTPGGVAEPIHIVFLSKDGQAEILAEDQIIELKSRINSVEEALQQEVLHPAGPMPTTAATPSVPTPVPAAPAPAKPVAVPESLADPADVGASDEPAIGVSQTSYRRWAR